MEAPNGQPVKMFIIKVLMYNKVNPLKKDESELWCFVRDQYRRIEFHYKASDAMIKKVMNREKVYFKAFMNGTHLQIANEVEMQQW